MDVHAARGGERMLRRVITLLVAFAVLAERVAERSAWVRCFVLWILRRAEMVAADFVLERTGMPPAALERIAAVGNYPEDALRLAARFQALAALLRVLLPIDCPFGSRPARRLASARLATGSGRRPGGWTREPFDTS